MAKDAVFQVRMDSEIKENVEALYKEFGTSFAEAVRILAYQSLLQRKMPIIIEAPKSVNVDLMSADEIERKLQKSIEQINKGKGKTISEVRADHERRKAGVKEV